MKIKKTTLLIIITVLLILLIETISISKSNLKKEYHKTLAIAKPIINLEKDEMINTKVNQNSFPIEYYFSINNYNENEVNEIDFEYIIEIQDSNDSFPIMYRLFDCDSNREILLNDKKSEKMKIAKFQKQSRNFKLVMEWRELGDDLENQLQMQLKINVIQSKECE